MTPVQEEIQRLCRDFAAREIRPASLAVDEADTEHPAALWTKAAALGLTSFMLPEAYGGGGLTDCLTGCIVQEELSHGCAGIGNLLTSNGFFAEPVLALGTPEQRERWIAPLCGPEPPLTALATTEPESGSDAAAIRTTARRTGDGGYPLEYATAYAREHRRFGKPIAEHQASREHPVEKWMRDAKLEEIEEGTSDIQRLLISRGVLAGGERPARWS